MVVVPPAQCASAANSTFTIDSQGQIYITTTPSTLAATPRMLSSISSQAQKRQTDGRGCLRRTGDDSVVSVGLCDASPESVWFLEPCTASGCSDTLGMAWIRSSLDKRVLGLPGAVGPYVDVWTADNPTGVLHNELWRYNASDGTIRSLCQCTSPQGNLLGGCLASVLTPPPPPSPPPPSPPAPCTQWPRVKCFAPQWVGDLPQSKPPGGVVVNGPLLGNGDVGAVLGAADNGARVLFYFGKSDLWNTNADVDARSPKLNSDTFYRQLGGGSLSLALVGPDGESCAGTDISFNATQDMFEGAVIASTDCASTSGAVGNGGSDAPPVRLTVTARVLAGSGGASTANVSLLLLNLTCPACSAMHSVNLTLTTASTAVPTRAGVLRSATQGDTLYVAKDGVSEAFNSALLMPSDPNYIVWPTVRTFDVDTKGKGKVTIRNGTADACLRLVQTPAFPAPRIVTGPCTGTAADDWFLQPAADGGPVLLTSGLNSTLCAVRETPVQPFHASAGFVVLVPCATVTQSWAYDVASGQIRYNATACLAAVPPNLNISLALVPAANPAVDWAVTDVAGTLTASVNGASLRQGPGVAVAVGFASSRDVGGGQHVAAAAAQAQAVVASATSQAQAISQHEQWWASHWNRSAVILDDSRSLLESYWYGMQYMLGSTARPGKVAPGLWGVWAVTDAPAWNGVRSGLGWVRGRRRGRLEQDC